MSSAGTLGSSMSTSDPIPSPRSEILHYHDGTGSVIQLGNYKMLTSIKDTKGFAPVYVFEENTPNGQGVTQLECVSPSFVVNTMSSGSGSSGWGLGSVLLLATQSSNQPVMMWSVAMGIVGIVVTVRLLVLMLTRRSKSMHTSSSHCESTTTSSGLITTAILSSTTLVMKEGPNKGLDKVAQLNNHNHNHNHNAVDSMEYGACESDMLLSTHSNDD